MTNKKRAPLAPTLLNNSECGVAIKGKTVLIGIDDGHNTVVIYDSEGNVSQISSLVKIGHPGVQTLDAQDSFNQAGAVKVGDRMFGVGPAITSSLDLRTDDFPGSPHNVALIYYALARHLDDPSKYDIHIATGVPFSTFYKSGPNGFVPNRELVKRKNDAILAGATVYKNGKEITFAVKSCVTFPECHSAWFNFFTSINLEKKSGGGVTLSRVIDHEKLEKDVAIVDVGGRTTDVVTIMSKGLQQKESGTREFGALNIVDSVKESLSNILNSGGDIPPKKINECVHVYVSGEETKKVQFGRMQIEVYPIVKAAVELEAERIANFIKQKINTARYAIDTIIMIGGSCYLVKDALNAHLEEFQVYWDEQPEIANAKGFYIYLCDQMSKSGK